MTTTAPSSTQSEDPYADWRTEMERLSCRDANCSSCHGRGWTGLAKLPGGMTKLVTCRNAIAAQYPVHEIVRKEMEAVKNAIYQAIHVTSGGMEKRLMDEMDVLQKKNMLLAQVVMTPWWGKIFGIRLAKSSPPWAQEG